MSELPMSIEKAVARYKTIEVDGLKLYPVLVRDYEQFLIARPALEVLHQSLPVAMMRIPLLSALYQMDVEAASDGTPPSGLFSRAILALVLALRLGEGLETEERMDLLRVAADKENPAKLLRLRFTDENGEEKEITPAQFAELRKIIAAQNGVKIESEKANPMLVQAEKNAAFSAGMALDANMEDWISAISALSGESEEEIDEWPILKLQRRSESYKRILDYLVCGFGEVNGTTWQGGSPAPHPFFPKRRTESGILKPLDGSISANGKKEPPKAAQDVAQTTKNL